MDTETITLCAYHESARVAYAYQGGYYCESIELSEIDSGSGVSKLNGGSDNEAIQLILSNKAQPANSATSNHTIEVAKNLMKLYCAGSCAVAFFNNNMQIPAQTEMEIPGQDIKSINRVQTFLQNNLPAHPANYPALVISQIFGELQKEENWKVIDVLAQSILKNDAKKISRFYIEDALMKAGFKPVRHQTSKPVDMQVREDVASKHDDPNTKANKELNREELLNTVLTDFLKIVKKDWAGEELTAAVGYLKNIFEQFK